MVAEFEYVTLIGSHFLSRFHGISKSYGDMLPSLILGGWFWISNSTFIISEEVDPGLWIATTL